MTSSTPYESWGRYPTVAPRAVVPVVWRDQVPDLAALPASVLPYAYGRSYGDSCLNAGGVALDVTGLNRFISFDVETGLLRCEAGVLLADILDRFIPRGWFLPVSPGTKFVSVAGAIANDIHGKNHHRAGTWGCHVTQFELVRSTGQRLLCSPEENADLFRATIGGLGLTGLITWAEVRLKRIINAYIAEEQIRFNSLDEFLELTAESDATHEYTMSWADCLIGGAGFVRGHFIRGDHDTDPARAQHPPKKKPAIPVPVDLPSALLNTWTVKAFNAAYYHRQRAKIAAKVVPYDPFFYPLDMFTGWNRMYGTRGFLQYQCVVPFADDNAAIKEVFTRISRSGEGSFLVVLKTFGKIESPGMLSFPKPGVTLALDFPMHGPQTLRLLEDLDAVVRESGGAVYPAKDARMSVESFQAFFPQWREFAAFIDPKFSSSFWRRVTRA
jgi:FAD/FMN-containing dehydrogenase